jgi:hypothetical protein
MGDSPNLPPPHDGQPLDPDMSAYQPPHYLQRQAAQSRPLTPYRPRWQRQAWIYVAVIAVLVVGGLGIASAATAGPLIASMPPTSTADGSAAQSFTSSATQAPAATPTDTPPKPTATATAVPTATPTLVPTNTPVPPPPLICTDAGCSPWGYSFEAGNLIYSPPGNFCGYFNCIPSFWDQTNGYVMECQDSTYSHSGGVQGSCSHHGGNWRPLYAP